jgi:hypothetical protein
MQGGCPCQSGRSGLCIHVSATCEAVHHLKATAESIRKKNGSICTSELCKWIEPRQAPQGDLQTKPLRDLVFYKADPKNPCKQPMCTGRGQYKREREACFDPSSIPASLSTPATPHP